jgi:hypothetical protein
LQQQGFDYCYDKVLYDRLLHENAESVRMHLGADLSFQEKLVRFIENHDEPRAAATFGLQQSRAAAVTIATLPGAKLFHEGQFEGRRIQVPVFLDRWPLEPIDQDLQAFYRNLLQAVADPVFREGEWRLCQGQGWPTNSSYFNLAGWGWRQGEARRLVVVNLSPLRSQGRIQAPWEDLAGQTWQLADTLSGALYERDGSEMLSPGLFVDLEAWQFHFFTVQ